MALLRTRLFAGALFAGTLFGPGQDFVVPEQPAEQNYANLFKAIRTADAHEVRFKVDSRWKQLTPETYDIRRAVEINETTARSYSRFRTKLPDTHSISDGIRQAVYAKYKIDTPIGAAQAPFIRVKADAAKIAGAVSTGSNSPAIRVRHKTYHAHWTPETVQNLTDEMLMELV